MRSGEGKRRKPKYQKVIKIDLMTINAFRRPSKSDKIEPRRHPDTLAVAHNEAGEGERGEADGNCGVDVDVGDGGYDTDEGDNDRRIAIGYRKMIMEMLTLWCDKHIHDASSKVKTRSGSFSFCSWDTSRLL